MPSKNKKSTPVPEADFNDTIAHNRGLELMKPSAIPGVPAGYRPTDPEVRGRRLRRLAGDLRAEAMEALDEAKGRDLAADLGKFAPDPQRAEGIAARLGTTGDLVARAQALLDYAKEVDQIAMSDGLVFLETENKQLGNALDHDPALATHYRKLMKLFAARSGAIAEGIARAKGAEGAEPKAEAQAGEPKAGGSGGG